MYYHGIGVKQDYKISKKYIKLSAKLNNSVSLCNIARLYRYGKGVKQNYKKALKYYELAAQFNNMNAINSIGNMFYYSEGVERNYTISKNYYELAVKYNILAALNNLGDYYLHGFAEKIDYLKAKKFYELAAELNSSYAYLHLGDIYFNGYGVKQDYLNAKKYYELSSKCRNSLAFVKLGNLYKKGLGIEQNYIMAKQYYEYAAELGNSDALIKLAKMAHYGHGIEQSYFKAKKYYELAVDKNNIYAYFYLGYFHSNDIVFENDINKSIEYYSKCILKSNEKITDYNSIDNCAWTYYKYNKYFYRSSNDLGLIYLINFSDIKTAKKHLQDAAFAEYPFGQNNFGLLCQFYLNKLDDAKYFYKKSAKHNFVLADFNLGNLYTKKGNIEKAIKHYIKASKNENEILTFHNHHQYDKQLEISKLFIVCFINLKLSEHYLSQNKYEESKKHFVKTFSNFELINDNSLANTNIKIRILKYNETVSNEYLSSFMLFISLILNLKKYCELENFDTKSNDTKLNNQKLHSINDIYKFENLSWIFNNIGCIFDYFILKSAGKILISEIHHSIELIDQMIYNPPFKILFGRIKITNKSNINRNSLSRDINEHFYEGFNHGST